MDGNSHLRDTGIVNAMGLKETGGSLVVGGGGGSRGET